MSSVVLNHRPVQVLRLKCRFGRTARDGYDRGLQLFSPPLGAWAMAMSGHWSSSTARASRVLSRTATSPQMHERGALDCQECTVSKRMTPPVMMAKPGMDIPEPAHMMTEQKIIRMLHSNSRGRGDCSRIGGSHVSNAALR